MSIAGFALPNPRFKAFVAGTNAPLAGGKVQFYLTNTNVTPPVIPPPVIPQAVFSDIACTMPLSNPVILDVNGEAEIYGNAIYDIDVYDVNNVLQYTMLGISFTPASNSIGSSTPEWIVQSGAVAYINTTSFTIAGNQTNIFVTGRRIQVAVTAGTLYGTIKSSSYSTSTTVVVSLDSGNLDSGLFSVAVGILNSQNTSIPTLNPLPSMTGGTTAYFLTIQRGDLIAGTRIQATINATNTDASTLVVNSGTAKAITKQGATALVANDMLINGVADLEYDGTEWQLLNPATVAQTAQSIPGANIVNNSITPTQLQGFIGSVLSPTGTAHGPIQIVAGAWTQSGTASSWQVTLTGAAVFPNALLAVLPIINGTVSSNADIITQCIIDSLSQFTLYFATGLTNTAGSFIAIGY